MDSGFRFIQIKTGAPGENFLVMGDIVQKRISQAYRARDELAVFSGNQRQHIGIKGILQLCVLV